MKKFLLLLLLLVCCSCAKQGPITETPEKEIAQARWDLMLSDPQVEPFRIQFSLRFGEEGNTRRVTGILWGNSPETLRMDIMAGVGVVIARIADSPDKFLLYSPRENKAYAHEGEEKPMLKIGMPLPFTLRMLAALLEGQYASVFGTSYASAEPNSDGTIAYTLNEGPKGLLDVNLEGVPVSWQQGPKGWRMSITPEENSRLPKSLRFSNTNGKIALVLVKEREKSEAFNSEQMELSIPENIPLLPLSKYRPS